MSDLVKDKDLEEKRKDNVVTDSPRCYFNVNSMN